MRDTIIGISIDNKKITINDLYNRWKKLKKGLKDNTFSNYKYSYEQFVEPEFGKIKLTDLKRTDVRAGELTGLRWEDVDFDENTISVNHTLVYFSKGKQNGCTFAVNTPKTEAGKRIIPMLSEVSQALLNEREYQKEAEITCQVTIDGYTDFVFLNRYGNVHNPQAINRAISRFLCTGAICKNGQCLS